VSGGLRFAFLMTWIWMRGMFDERLGLCYEYAR
jgi:hypothetical protein